VLSVMPLPADTNSNGDIFGGWLMARRRIRACDRLEQRPTVAPAYVASATQVSRQCVSLSCDRKQ